MKIGSRNSTNITVSNARRERMQEAELNRINYGDAEAVRKARDAITHMGLRDTIVDMSEGGAKREVLERLADVVLCEKAASWQWGGADRVPCEDIARLDRREVQIRFLETLSPEGRKAIVAPSEETVYDIQFSPDTEAELGDALQELEGRQWSKAAQDLRSNGSHPLAAKAWKQAALHFRPAEKNIEAAEAYEQAASDLMADGPDRIYDGQRHAAEALGAAAENWQQAGRHDNAATCRQKESEYLTTLGLRDEAAFSTQMEMVQLNSHTGNYAAATLHPDPLSVVLSHLPTNADVVAAKGVNKHWNNAVPSWHKHELNLAKAAIGRVVDAGLKGLESALEKIGTCRPLFGLSYSCSWSTDRSPTIRGSILQIVLTTCPSCIISTAQAWISNPATGEGC